MLAVLLAALLAWSIVAGVGNLRTQILIGIGVVLGLVYTCFGHLPEWIVDCSGLSITDDDDPSNIPPRIYLPILLGVILLALAAVAVAVFLL
ncbi:hypothetical protein GC176_03720 [bacterium]|nr:hypothetical protein [bacterium]